MLADTKRWRGLLARPGRPSGCRRRTWCGGDDHRRGYRDDLLLLILGILIIVVDRDDHPDLDRDVVGVVQFDRVTLRRLGGRCLRIFLIDFDGGVGWFFGHSGSYVTDG
jgi:hypothetical protein